MYTFICDAVCSCKNFQGNTLIMDEVLYTKTSVCLIGLANFNLQEGHIIRSGLA